MLTRTLIYLAACTLTTIPLVATATDGEVNPALSAADLPGLTIIRLDLYEGKALYGYIDGGAELYREYGFVRLTVQQCLYAAESMTIELYVMSDSLAALGTFSVTTGPGVELDVIGTFSRVSRYAVQWATSRYVVRVVNAQGSDNAQRATVTVARALAQKLNGTPATLPAWTLSFTPSLRQLKYVRGPLGLQNGFDSWSGVLEGVERFEAYFLLLDTNADQPVIADIRFGNDADRAAVSDRLARQEDSRHVFWEREPARLIVLESRSDVDSLRSVLEAHPGGPL